MQTTQHATTDPNFCSMETKPTCSHLMQITGSVVIVILGASGDLAKKFLYPAHFTLFRRNLLPPYIYIIGYARSVIEHDAFIAQVTSNIKDPGNDPNFAHDLEKYKAILSYRPGSYNDPSAFVALNQYLCSLEGTFPSSCKTKANRVFYLALPSTVFVSVSENLKKYVSSSAGINRLVVEKPIGSDLESALELVKGIAQFWSEEDTFRIDHYLGQEIVRNLIPLRFTNSLFDAIWDAERVSNVQITMNESFGAEGRGGYFDSAGMIRDVIQNHLCQVLTILTMERPLSLTSADITEEKVKLLQCVPPARCGDTLLGQYAGYTDDPTVPAESTTATYAAVVLWINNPRWKGVPFILKAGKALNEDNVEIRLQFKDANKGLYDKTLIEHLARDELVMHLEPGQTTTFKLNNKMPGFQEGIVSMEFKLNYKDSFPDAFVPDPYEVLLLDVIKGDHSMFVRDDELEAAWKIFTPILHWTDGEPKPVPVKYARGSKGPAGLDEFLTKYGYKALA